MLEIGAVDSAITPVYQLNTKRAAFNPFAPVDEMSDVDSTSKAKENPFNTSEQVIDAFNLYDPKNRLVILSLFSREQQQEVLTLLGKDSMVLGMKLFDEEKILNLLFDTSQKQISQVLLGTMPVKKIFELIPEEFLNNFLLSRDLEKTDFMKGFEKISPEELTKYLETITGVPQKGRSQKEMLKVFEQLPMELLQPSLLATKPEQKITLISNMVKDNNELFRLFPKAQLLIPLDEVGKEKTLNGMGNLEEGDLNNMLKQMPEELLPLLLTLIEPEKLANALIEKYQDVIQKALSGQAIQQQ